MFCYRAKLREGKTHYLYVPLMKTGTVESNTRTAITSDKKSPIDHLTVNQVLSSTRGTIICSSLPFCPYLGHNGTKASHGRYASTNIAATTNITCVPTEG